MSDDFRQLIEEVKLRLPIEEVVRERVAELRQRGRLWEACCPFHEERTPSFKVDPQRGTWRCYGACADGGDIISFVERFDRLNFMEALEILAARVGLKLPQKRGADDRRDRLAPLYDLLLRAQEFYARELWGSRGAQARAYWEQRGILKPTLEAFGVGFAGGDGEVLVGRARAAETRFEDLEAVGLARRSERGRAYDFFRDRHMIPIRDFRSRPVGFGGRRVHDTSPAGGQPPPKYVNTPETPLFHKGRLVYGLDRALDRVRRERHLILMEGYTDVMAAHQVGLSQVAAVLGTALTDEHAALVRKSGAQRVTLVFDGDEAGRQATKRALHGLLPLELEIDVVAPPEGQDPCDLFVSHGDAPFRASLETATGWLEFLLEGLHGLGGTHLSAALDEILGLITRIAKPLHREGCLGRVATHCGYPVSSVREQFESLPERVRERRAAPLGTAAPAAGRARPNRAEQLRAMDQSAPTRRAASGRAHSAEDAEADAASEQADRDERAESAQPQGSSDAQPGTAREPEAAREISRSERRAWGELAGALLLDGSLVPVARPLVSDCPDEELRALLVAMCAVAERSDGLVDESSLLTELAEHPARRLVGAIAAHAARAESPPALFDGASKYLSNMRERQRIAREKSALSTADDSQLERSMRELHQRLREMKSPQLPGEASDTRGSQGALPAR